jgi:hypothetical protein
VFVRLLGLSVWDDLEQQTTCQPKLELAGRSWTPPGPLERRHLALRVAGPKPWSWVTGQRWIRLRRSVRRRFEPVAHVATLKMAIRHR